MYREVGARAGLAGAIDCYWFRTGREDGGTLVNRILPDGCMDIIVNLGDPILGDGAAVGGTAFVVGAMSTARRVLLRGRIDTIGIRFRAGMAPGYLREDASRLTDALVDLGAFWRPAEARELAERLAEARTDRDRAGVLDSVLASGRAPQHDVGVSSALRAIRQARGMTTVRELARTAGMSPRQLQRRFAERVGLSPKLAARIARFGHAAKLLRERTTWTGARVAMAAGYHDQPHMVRDFHDLAGLSPSAYLAERVASVQDEGSGVA